MVIEVQAVSGLFSLFVYVSQVLSFIGRDFIVRLHVFPQIRVFEGDHEFLPPRVTVVAGHKDFVSSFFDDGRSCSVYHAQAVSDD